MPAIVTELFADRVQTIESSGKYKSLELVYLVREVELTQPEVFINNVAYPATTEWFALEAVRSHAPRVVYGMARKELRVIEKIEESSYKVGVTYEYSGTQSPSSSDDDTEAGDRTITFSSTSGTRHITHSFLTVARIGDVPDQDGAINVDHDNNINGVDVLAPSLTFTETHYFTYRKFKISYIRDLNALQGRVNDRQFRGFNAGEVRFDGFSATRRGSKRDDLYEITFQFSVIPNQPPQIVQGLEIPAKLGWDYIWFRAKSAEAKAKARSGDGPEPGDPSPGDPSSGVTSKIEGAYIERIYLFGDFGKLQIKTAPFTPVEPEQV